MGNYASCTLPGQVSKSFVRATKVISPSGEVLRLYEQSKAAELMLEAPNCFLVNVKTLQIGRRFLALSADDDLEIGGFYAFFPMKRRKSAATEADVAALFTAADSAGARRVSRVLPERRSSEDFEDLMKHRASVLCKSRKPLLETIAEEPIYLR